MGQVRDKLTRCHDGRYCCNNARIGRRKRPSSLLSDICGGAPLQILSNDVYRGTSSKYRMA
jgi:hypothetical protein